VDKTKRGKGTKVMAVTDAVGLVLSVTIASASPHEVTLVEKVLDERFLEPLPEKLIGDKAYDSDPLDQKLKDKGVELIAPHRQNRKKKCRMAESSEDIKEDGRLNPSFPGCLTSAEP
jgi:hypothetical protein